MNRFKANFIIYGLLISFSFSCFATTQPPLIAVAAEHKLLQYIEDGKVQGPSAEIFKLLLKYSDLDGKIEFYPWSRAYHTALTRKDTLILSMVRTQERQDNFHWLIKVGELVRGFISLKRQPKNTIKLVKDARNKSIVVLRNSYSHHSLIKMGLSHNLYPVSSLEEAIALFLSAKVDLIYTDPNVVINYLKRQQQVADDVIAVHILPQTRRESYIAANKQTDQRLLTKLKSAALKLQSDPLYQYYLAFKPVIDE